MDLSGGLCYWGTLKSISNITESKDDSLTKESQCKTTAALPTIRLFSVGINVREQQKLYSMNEAKVKSVHPWSDEGITRKHIPCLRYSSAPPCGHQTSRNKSNKVCEPP